MESDLKAIWRGYTCVLGLNFQTDMSTGVCDVTLELSESERPGAQTITVRFEGVAALELKAFGGGLTQILGLSISDIRGEQRDRINFRVYDAEHGAISFLCRHASVKQRGTLTECG